MSTQFIDTFVGGVLVKKRVRNESGVLIDEAISDADPATGAAAVTPHDTNALAGGTTRALYIGGAGNVKVTFADGQEVTLSGVLAGIVYPFCVTHVWSTSTTATNIVALY